MKKIDFLSASHKVSNPVIISILNSKIHPLMSSRFAVLNFVGTKSGREYRTPVVFHEIENTIVVLGYKVSKWWRNFRVESSMSLTLRGANAAGKALAIESTHPEYTGLLEQVFCKYRLVDRTLGINYNRQSGLTNQQIEVLSNSTVVVRIKI